jgi:hypothetical protein
MQLERTQLRDEMLAMLAANRELLPDADEYLVDAFLTQLDGKQGLRRPSKTLRCARVGFATRWSPFRLGLPTIAAITAIEIVLMAIFGTFLIAIMDLPRYSSYVTQVRTAVVVLWAAQVAVTIGILCLQDGLIVTRHKSEPPRTPAE